MKPYNQIIPEELKIISNAMQRLKDKKIIRTKNLVGDLGEYYCRELFGLTLHENVVEKGFDAFDSSNKKVEIKTRRTPKGIYKVIFRGFEFDYCLFVELNENYEPNIIMKIEVNELKKYLDKKGDRLSVNTIKKKTVNKILFQSIS